MQFGKRKCPWPLVFHGLILVCAGITLLIYREAITNILFDDILVLKPSSLIVEEWSNPSAAVDIKLYFFNWTNPTHFTNKSVKPKFKEMGPYFFRQKYHKVDITFNENFTVTYRNNKTFFFDEQQSGGSLDDDITSLNIIPVLAVDKARKWNFFLRKGLSIALNSVPYESTRKMGELLFTGYEDPLLSFTKYLPMMKDIPSMDKFAWFYKRNGSADYEGVFTVGTGQGNTSVGTLYKWNYKDRGPYPGNYSAIQAPTELFPQHVKKDKLEFFFSDFCRKVILDFNKTITYEGIEAYKFTGDVSFLESGNFNTDTSCLSSRKCQKFGVIDYSKCKFGIPAYLSLPHFSKADPSFRNAVEGMMPDQKNHEMYLIINPRTGVVLDLNIGIQINMLIQPNPGIRKYADVPEIMFPLFWFSVQTKLPESFIIKLKVLIFMPAALKAVSAFLVFLGMIILIHSLHRRLAEIQRRRYRRYQNRLRGESKPLDAKRNCERT